MFRPLDEFFQQIIELPIQKYRKIHINSLNTKVKICEELIHAHKNLSYEQVGQGNIF